MAKTPDTAPHRLPAEELRDQLMLRAAKLYYSLERTQGQIAEELGLTRWQVSRLLSDARQSGLVRIEIVPRAGRRPDLEARLQKAFGLAESIVVAGGDTGGDEQGFAVESVAQAAGQFLASQNPKVSFIGVSWGRTMAAVAHWLPPQWSDGVHVVLVNGATMYRSGPSESNSVAERFAQTGNGTATLLPVPTIVGARNTRRVLEHDPVIANIMAMARHAPMVCFGLGALSKSSVLVDSGYLEPKDVDRLAADGAVGDILGRFVDAAGQVVDPELDARTIGLRPQELRGRCAVAICAGRAKHAIALACLRAGYVNVLVTDEATAAHALENDGRPAKGV
jgi:deoxyribonucleoside regulator